MILELCAQQGHVTITLQKFIINVFVGKKFDLIYCDFLGRFFNRIIFIC